MLPSYSACIRLPQVFYVFITERPIPGSASASTVTSSDFHRVLSYSGLPVSAVEIALLARLFTAPDLTIDHARFLQFASTGMHHNHCFVLSRLFCFIIIIRLGVLSPSSLPVSFDRPHTQARPSSAIARTTSNAGLLDLLQKLPPEQHAVATMVAQALGVEASAAAAHTSRPASVASPPRHSFGSASAHPQQHASKHHRQHSSISFASTVEGIFTDRLLCCIQKLMRDSLRRCPSGSDPGISVCTREISS